MTEKQEKHGGGNTSEAEEREDEREGEIRKSR